MTETRTRRRIEAAGLLAVLLIAAGLRLWRLEDNGFGTTYYAAGVRSLLQGGWLFFYNAFDPAGFVSLDKPPLAFWIQGAFAALLGFNGWTIHLPQALAGVASVALLYRLVRRPFGAAAGLIAALLLAMAPVAVAIDRSNNTDSWLVFFLLLAAGSALRGRGPSLVISMALLGLAFNVKMLAALVCGPALLAAWLLSSVTLDWRRRMGWMMASGIALVVVALSWAVAFDLTPKESRPYAGSTAGNSMLELIVIHNGYDRFTVNLPPDRSPVELYDDVAVGPLRLAQPILAAQFAWMLPLAVLGLVLVRRRDRSHASLALWGLWAVAYGIVYSLAGGIFHIYYLATLAPPLAALAGIGCLQLWRRGPLHVAAGLAASALWQGWLAGASLGWVSTWMGFPAVALLAAGAVLWRGKRPPATIGGVALLALPAVWALSAIYSPGNLTLPSASLPRWLGIADGRGPALSRTFTPLTDDPRLIQFLTDRRGGSRFLVAAPTAMLAAPIIVRTGLAALAAGGYLGSDPILGTDALAALVARGELRFAVVSNRGRQGSFARWVRANGTVVDPAQWRSVQPEPWRSIALYELKVN